MKWEADFFLFHHRSKFNFHKTDTQQYSSIAVSWYISPKCFLESLLWLSGKAVIAKAQTIYYRSNWIAVNSGVDILNTIRYEQD